MTAMTTDQLRAEILAQWEDTNGGQTAKNYLRDVLNNIVDSYLPIGVDARVILSGDVTVGAGDTLIVLNKATPAATNFALPSVAARSPSGLQLAVFDFPGTGGPMQFSANGTETIMGSTAPWPVLSSAAPNGGSLLLIPSIELNGWLVR